MDEEDDIELRPLPEYVFEGSHSALPLNSRYVVSIDRKGLSAEYISPENLEAAFKSLEKSLPAWFLNALANARGDYECSVSVNDLHIEVILVAWLRENWTLDSISSLIAKELEGLGIKKRSKNGHYLVLGFCQYLRHDFEFLTEFLACISEASDNNDVNAADRCYFDP